MSTPANSLTISSRFEEYSCPRPSPWLVRKREFGCLAIVPWGTLRRPVRSPVIDAQPLHLAEPRARWYDLNWSNIIYWTILQVGVVLAPFLFSWTAVSLAVVFYVLTALGMTVGYHRLLTHRSFQTPILVEYVLALLGSLANQGGPMRWVATHRLHHQFSDEEGDPHSPRHGVWWAHLLWWMPYSPVLDDPVLYQQYVPDLARDRYYRFLQHWSVLPPMLLAALLFGLGELWAGEGLAWLVWAVFVRTTMLYHATWFINSAAHVWGYRNHETRDRSTNVWWLAICSLGEGWHNNHHAHPRSACNSLRWWELDLSYWVIRLLGAVGLARHIHVRGKVLKTR